MGKVGFASQQSRCPPTDHLLSRRPRSCLRRVSGNVSSPCAATRLSTHVLLWGLLEPQMFLGALLKILEDSNNTLVVSAATAREIASQWSQGKPWQAQAVVVLG